MGLLMLALGCSLGPNKRNNRIFKSKVKKINLLCDILQLTNLFVEISNVMFNDISQLLYLHWLIIKYSFPLAEQSKFLQFCVGVSDVTTDTLGDIDELGIVSSLGSVHSSIHLSASQTLNSVSELQSSLSAACAHHCTKKNH